MPEKMPRMSIPFDEELDNEVRKFAAEEDRPPGKFALRLLRLGVEAWKMGVREVVDIEENIIDLGGKVLPRKLLYDHGNDKRDGWAWLTSEEEQRRIYADRAASGARAFALGVQEGASFPPPPAQIPVQPFRSMFPPPTQPAATPANNEARDNALYAAGKVPHGAKISDDGTEWFDLFGANDWKPIE